MRQSRGQDLWDSLSFFGNNIAAAAAWQLSSVRLRCCEACSIASGISACLSDCESTLNSGITVQVVLQRRPAIEALAAAMLVSAWVRGIARDFFCLQTHHAHDEPGCDSYLLQASATCNYSRVSCRLLASTPAVHPRGSSDHAASLLVLAHSAQSSHPHCPGAVTVRVGCLGCSQSHFCWKRCMLACRPLDAQLPSPSA